MKTRNIETSNTPAQPLAVLARAALLGVLLTLAACGGGGGGGGGSRPVTLQGVVSDGPVSGGTATPCELDTTWPSAPASPPRKQ